MEMYEEGLEVISVTGPLMRVSSTDRIQIIGFKREDFNITYARASIKMSLTSGERRKSIAEPETTVLVI